MPRTVNPIRCRERNVPEFITYKAFTIFAGEVLRARRFIRTSEQESFLESVMASSGSRSEELPASTPFWRARLGCEYLPYQQDGEYICDEPCPYEQSKMKPRFGQATEGRANPKGISYLYGASHRDTAVAEVRPWVGGYVSVGVFQLNRNLRLVNTTSDDTRRRLYSSEPSPEERERVVWNDIDRAFARPVQPSDDVALYATTQILAEVFRANGYDGVAYRSSLGIGHNLVLFDPEVADLTHAEVVEVKSMSLIVQPVGGPFSVWEPRAP